MRSLPFFFAGLCLLSPAFAQNAPASHPASDVANTPAVKPDDTPTIKQVKVGDRWTYQLKDEISGELKNTETYTVTDVSGNQIGVRGENLGSPGAGFNTFDRSWNLLSNGQWKFVPNDGSGVRLPLAVGKSWTFRYNQILPVKGVAFRVAGTSKVVAQEKMTTDAGTFDTYKIETTLLSRYASDPTKRYDTKITSWYAPAVDHWVKRVFNLRFEGHLRQSNVLELIEYDSGE